MTTLDELVLRVKADTTDINAKLGRLTTQVRRDAATMASAFGGLKSQLAGLVPAVTVGAVSAFTLNALKAADAINDMSQRTGIAGSTLSALNIKLLQSGSSLEEFSGALVRMNNSIGEAGKGNQEAVKAYDSIGLSVRKLQQLNTEEQFIAIANALAGVKDQSKFTEAGINILGRQFAVLGPTIREAGGDMQGFIDKQKQEGSLTQEQLDRIDEWGDRWTSAIEHAKLALVDYLDYFYKLGQETRSFFEDLNLPDNASYTRPKTLSDDEVAKRMRAGMRAKGFDVSEPTDARGDNRGLLKDPEAERQANALQAYRDYIAAIEDENYLLSINETEREGVRAAMEAQKLAQKAGIKISEEDREKIVGLTNANRELSKSMAEAERFGQELKDKLSDGLADIVFSFDSASDAAKRFAEQIAKMIIERSITGPLAEQLVGGVGGGGGGVGGLLGGLFGGGGGGDMRQVGIAYEGSGYTGGYFDPGGGLFGGIGDFFGGFFADGGRPPVGRPSIVGERGPEIFVPDSAGTVYPNGSSMGGVSVTNVFNISPGVQGTVEAEVRRMAPVIAAQAQAGVFRAIERGGKEAQLVNRRP